MAKPATTYRVQAGIDDDRARIDSMLANRVPELSRSRIKALIAQGRVMADGATITEPAYRVKPGQTFTVTVPPPVPAVPQPQAMPLEIVHEDADIIVIDKPAGLVVHPGPGNPDRTLVNGLIAHCGETLQGIGGVRRPGIVHRLDKDTSGVLLLGRTARAAAALTAAFRHHEIHKLYWALVVGVPEPRAGRIALSLAKRAGPGGGERVTADESGRAALTEYRVIETVGRRLGWLALTPRTGRTHQLRAHCAALGIPILGDRKYGAAGAFPAGVAAPGLHLHARAIELPRPEGGGGLRVVAPLPEHMRETWRRLGFDPGRDP